MNLDSELARDLERAIPDLPTVPATAYLVSGRRARRRRHAIAGVAGVAVLALTGGAVLSTVGAPATSPADPATSGPSTTSDQIPAWAEEYGNHGTISIYPNGKLWVAPDARLIRSVEIPADSFPHDDLVSAYAAEAELDGDVWWSFVFRTSHSATDRPAGVMEPAGDWTTDFDLWVDYATADMQGRRQFSERLVRFANGSSEELVARAGAQIVDQTADVVLTTWEKHPRSSAAEVIYRGKSWYVLAMGPARDKPFYAPYEAALVPEPGLDGFLDYLDRYAS